MRHRLRVARKYHCAFNSQAALLVHVESENNRRRGLLFRHDSVFYTLAQTELKSRFGGNLNRLAGLRITPLTRFAFRQHQFAKTRQSELAVVLDFVARQFGQLIEKVFHLGTLQAGFLSKMVENLGLRHAFLAFFCRHVEVWLPPADWEE